MFSSKLVGLVRLQLIVEPSTPHHLPLVRVPIVAASSFVARASKTKSSDGEVVVAPLVISTLSTGETGAASVQLILVPVELHHLVLVKVPKTLVSSFSARASKTKSSVGADRNSA